MSVLDNQFTFSERARQKIKQMVHYPITLLISPSGYGKSHFLQEFKKSLRMAICHITLKNKDRFLNEFIRHLTTSLSESYPNTNWEEINQPIYPSILFEEEVAHKWLQFLKEKVESIDQPAIIIIENYHFIDEDSFINRLLNRFINMLPSNLHILISSRTYPSGDAFKRAELQNRLLEINEQDLHLSFTEMKSLFYDQYRFPLSEQDLEQIYLLTLGWKMPIHTVYLFLARGGNMEQIKKNPIASLSTFFEFVESEIIKPLPIMIQGFLFDLSVLEEIDVELLNHLYHGNSAEFFHLLEKHRVLIHSKEKSTKQLHPLIKLFLRSKVERQWAKQLHRKVSYYYISKEDYTSSIPYLIGAHEWEELAYLLSKIGARLIQLGHLKVVYEGILALPGFYKTAFPRTMIVEGDYHRLHSDYNTALQLYKRAYDICFTQGDQDGTILAIEGEVQIYLDTVKPNKAQALIKKALQQLKVSTEWKARFIHLMAENYINSGKPNRAKRILRLGRKLSIEDKNEIQESRILLRTGQLQAVDALLQKEEMKPKEETPLLHGFRETSLVHSLVNTFMGQSDVAKKRAQQGILLGTQMKSPFIEATGWARMGHAMQVVTPFNFKLAEECYLTSLQIFAEVGVDWGQAEPLMGLALLHGFAGNYDLAMNYGAQACRIANGVTDQWMYQLTQLCMGIAAYNVEKYEEAIEKLTACLVGIRKCGDYFLETVSLLWISYSYFQLEKEEEALRYFDDCLHLISQYNYEFLLLKRSFFSSRDLQTNVPLLLEIQQQKRANFSVATKIVKELGFSQAKFHPGYTLKIETLGGFRVWLGEREVLEKDWQRANAKRLFQYFITKRKQEILKEVIQVDLWPEMDEDTLDRDFKVALNALTKALEPDRKARSSSFYIIRNGSTYRINPDSGYELDAEMFQNLFEEGLREKDEALAKHKLESGYYLYKGDFLADNLYEDWAIEERERLQVLFLRGSEKYAQILLNNHEYEQAIQIAEKIVEKDPCWEEAYRIIMYCYYKLMNRTMALRWYEKCKMNLTEELGIEPMITTRKLKDQIQNGEEIDLGRIK